MKTDTKKQDPACCPLGRRGDIGAINSALRNGMNVREVAKLYGVGKTAVGDHRAKCLRLPPASRVASPVDDVPRAPKAPDAEADTCPEEAPDSGQIVRTVFEAPRARLAPHAKDAKTFLEQSLVCADMVAAGTWEGRPSVRWLSALWGLSADAVRERHRAGAVCAQADRGAIEAERQNSIGALQEQERMALDAYEDSKFAVDKEGNALGVGDARLLAAATKARTEIARIAGCMPQTGAGAVVNIYQTPQFIEATTRVVETFHAALDPMAIAALMPDVDPAVVARVLAVAARLAEEKVAAITTPPDDSPALAA